MANDLENKRELKLVPIPDPNSLPSADPLSILPRDESTGGIRWSCTPVRPYLVVLSTPSSDPAA